MRDLAREVLEEFAAVCLGFRDRREDHADPEVSWNLDHRSRRIAYHKRNYSRGLCRNCRRPAVWNKRKTRLTRYCSFHRDLNISRARRSQARAANMHATACAGEALSAVTGAASGVAA